jgi:hypothetical protein
VDTLFPFGFPFPTAFYLTVYLGTLMLHIVFMNYVLAGSAHLLGRAVLRGAEPDPSRVSDVLRDWLPFMLSAAITAGIAPLLFLQILYQQQFYTANLLLFYRWMAILPVLIAGFYLAYVLKSRRVGRWPLAARAVVGAATFGCFAFIGWSWVENHLLSVHPEAWEQQYASDSVFYVSAEAVPRFALWFVAAFPTMALMVAWQIWWAHRHEADAATSPGFLGARPLAVMALVTLGLSSLCCGAYFALMTPTAQSTILKPLAFPYAVLAALGTVVEIVAWLFVLRRGRIVLSWLIVVTAGLVVNFLGMAVVNEATRLAALDIRELYQRHESAWRVSGLPAFVAFFFLNGGLMLYCVKLTQRERGGNVKSRV